MLVFLAQSEKLRCLTSGWLLVWGGERRELEHEIYFSLLPFFSRALYSCLLFYFISLFFILSILSRAALRFSTVVFHSSYFSLFSFFLCWVFHTLTQACVALLFGFVWGTLHFSPILVVVCAEERQGHTRISLALTRKRKFSTQDFPTLHTPSPRASSEAFKEQKLFLFISQFSCSLAFFSCFFSGGIIFIYLSIFPPSLPSCVCFQ